MNRPRSLSPSLQIALMLGLGLAAIYAAMIPLGPGGGQVAPDVLYCLVIAWVVRRPALVPIWLVLALGLFGDLMLARPVGLGALGLLVASETMRANTPVLHGTPFVLEWLAAVLAFVLMLAGMVLVLELTFADRPDAATLLRHVIATAIAYPVVVLGLVVGLRLRAPHAARPGDRLGRLS